MKGVPKLPGGPLKSKPTWRNAQVRAILHAGFFVLMHRHYPTVLMV